MLITQDGNTLEESFNAWQSGGRVYQNKWAICRFREDTGDF
jgi:hypothetical protein